MRAQWSILGGTSVGAIVFMIVLLVRLAHFEGHRSTKRRRAPRQVMVPAAPSVEMAKARSARAAARPGAKEAAAEANLRRLLLGLMRAKQPTRREAQIDPIQDGCAVERKGHLASFERRGPIVKHGESRFPEHTPTSKSASQHMPFLTKQVQEERCAAESGHHADR